MASDEGSAIAKVTVLRTVPSVNGREGETMDSGRFPGTVDRVRAAWASCTKGTVFSSVFILLTTSVGAGTLSLPYAFAQGGLVISSVVLLLVVLVAVMSGVYLFAAKRYCTEVFPEMEVWGYEDLAQAAFGAIGRIAVLVTLVVLLFLSLIAYMIYARDQLDQIIQFALEKTGHIPSCSPLVNCAVLMAMAFIPIFPVTLLRTLTPLQITSTVSFFCIAYMAVVTLIKTSLAWANLNGSPNTTNLSATTPTVIPPDHHIQLWPVGVTGLLTSISYCSLSFVCQFNLLPLQRELKGPQRKWRLYSIVIWATLLAYGLYNVVIFSGYFNFFGTLQTDIMLNYPHNDILVTTARVALFLTLVLNYPVLLHPMRGSFNRLLAFLYNSLRQCMTRQQWEESQPLLPKSTSTEWKIPTLVWFCETWVIFGASFLPASFIPNVGYVWNFVGSIGGVLVFYVYPAAFYLRLRYLRYMHRAKKNQVTVCSQYDVRAVGKEVVAYTILFVGLLLVVVENYQAIDAIVTGVHKFQPSSLCTQTKCGSGVANLTGYR